MAEEQPNTEGKKDGEEKPAGRPGGNSLLLVIIIIILAVAGGGAAYFFLLSGKGGHAENAKEKKEAKKEAKSSLVALDPFVMNLAEQGRFLKVSMQFEVADEANQPVVGERMPQLRDAVITLVSSKSADALASPEGKFQLKDELLLRANQAVGKDVFKNLFFTEFVMQ
jgi:flagellar FliL protein